MSAMQLFPPDIPGMLMYRTDNASQETGPNLPRMGERLRLRADYDTSGFSPPVRTIFEGLKKYGMFVADNGIEWALSRTPDERIPVLHEELRA